MKRFLIIILLSFSAQQNFGQITNIQAGLWSDPAIWVNHTPPVPNDSVLLNFNITVGADAVCKYLNTNGHNLTVNPGVNLFISGGSVLSNPADTFLLKKFVVLDTTQAAPNDTLYVYDYTYDSLKRCTQIKVANYKNGKAEGVTYFYGSNKVLLKELYTNGKFKEEIKDETK